MIKKGTFSIGNVNISVEQKCCQEFQYRIAHYDHFHSPKNPTVEYQITNDRFVLTFDFGAKPSYHNIGIICRLVEEEFYLRKSYMETKGRSENFAVNVKKEEVRLLFSNYYKEI